MVFDANEKLSRRSFLTRNAALIGFSATAGSGLLAAPANAAGHDEWMTPEPDEAAAGALNFKTWSGYDAGNVTGPFSEEWGVPIDISLFTDNPAAFNEIKGGKSEFYDLASFDMAWVPRLAKAGLIRKLDLETWKTLAWDHYIDQFRLENYKFAQLNENMQFDSDGDLYGLPQRFGVVSAYANTERVPEDVWSTSYDWVWNPGKDYNIGLLDRMFWTIQLIMLWCNIDPYKVHTEEELGTVREETIKLFQNAKALFSNAPQVNQALLHEEIDVCFEGDNFINGPLRQDGHLQFRTIVPARANPEFPKAPNNAGGTTWVETMVVVDNSKLHPATYDYLVYMQKPSTAYELSWPDKGPAVLVPHKEPWERWSEEQRVILEADYMQTMIESSRWYEGVPDLDKFNSIWEEAKQHIGEKHAEAKIFPVRSFG
ncbi:MAG: hypothetical protein MAG794_00409 [Gammaproteobacteria bacterium]|nr:hypothetical protein [Gammaproteobacteria bacterium]